MQTGKEACIIVSNLFIRKVTILDENEDFVTVRFESGGGIRIWKSRLFESEDQAQIKLNEDKARRASSYLFSH